MATKPISADAANEPAPALSFADAAENLLRASGKPMSHKELAKRALSQKLVATESLTPQISMHVGIRSDMKRREQRGEPQRFLFLGNGLFSLVDLEAGSPTEKAKTALEQIRESRGEAANDLHKRLTAENNGPDFELLT